VQRVFQSRFGWNLIAGLLLATIIALALRCPDLSVRPMHNDEAVNAIKFRSLMERGIYRYDPNEYHGPTLYYFTLAWTKLTGVSDFEKLTEARLRALTVLFGVGLILLLPLIADGLGRGATICGALLTAISPAMVFYSRYYIHEMLLVCFTFLALAAGWRWFRDKQGGWAILAGVALGLMHATKETFILALAAMAVAIFMNGKWVRGRDAMSVPGKTIFKTVATVLIAWMIVATVFFSSFLTNPAGLVDAAKTFLPMAHRAAGDSAHNHPWTFYFERLIWFHPAKGPVWSEGLILILAVAGAVSGLKRRGPSDSNADLVRFLTFYTGALATVYTLIPYKTPWCLLGFWHGAILLAGVGAVAIVRALPQRWMKIALTLALLSGAGHLALQARLASDAFSADRRNPYVYAQTSPDLLELVSEMAALARSSKQGHHLPVTVVAPGGDYWPLPWYLRAFDQAGWWSEMPPAPPTPVMIVSTKLATKPEENNGHVVAGIFQLRPGVFFALYVQPDLWRARLDSKTNLEK